MLSSLGGAFGLRGAVLATGFLAVVEVFGGAVSGGGKIASASPCFRNGVFSELVLKKRGRHTGFSTVPSPVYSRIWLTGKSTRPSSLPNFTWAWNWMRSSM